MKTHGSTRTHLLLLTILATSSVLSTGLQIYNLARNTSVENTSTNSESLEVRAGKFAVRVTGKNTMDLVTNLIPIENLLEMNVSEEK
tara:strand:+ start:122 stop:382 length:261 start_codon:yes stop_codon:yes gene_type:complete